ncbi:MAG: hypothetical protein J6S00_01695, partial [Clostridia bacterium]|nr:hypothetical protein [Clostridia bacterium]
MKRILAIILTVLMLVSALPLTALAATYEVDSGITAQTSTAFYELKDFDNVCTEEEFRELLSQYEPSFSKENSFYGETLDPKGYYYTYLSSSFERAVYNGCYNITST